MYQETNDIVWLSVKGETKDSMRWNSKLLWMDVGEGSNTLGPEAEAEWQTL